MVVDFFVEAAGLKDVPRQGWINKAGIKDPESVADHSYMTGIMSMTLSDMLGLDSSKIVKMALLHDLAESRTGDIMPGQMSAMEKKRIENEAVDAILDKLPKKIREKYRALWNEFQDAVSEEAILVHDVDKLEMALQAGIYSKNTNASKINIFYDSAQKSIQSSHMQRILDTIIKTVDDGK